MVFPNRTVVVTHTQPAYGVTSGVVQQNRTAAPFPVLLLECPLPSPNWPQHITASTTLVIFPEYGFRGERATQTTTPHTHTHLLISKKTVNHTPRSRFHDSEERRSKPLGERLDTSARDQVTAGTEHSWSDGRTDERTESWPGCSYSGEKSSAVLSAGTPTRGWSNQSERLDMNQACGSEFILGFRKC